MSATTGDTYHGNDARDNRVPPALRRWARHSGAVDIERYDNGCELTGRGVTVYIENGSGLVHVNDVPEGWEVRGIRHDSIDGETRIQLREE